jgi:WD40 repeat protein
MESEFIVCKSIETFKNYNFNFRKNGKCTRNLFTKKFGHTDWVTSCKFLSDGRIWSAGMDNLMCLWEAKFIQCKNMQGHNSTISKIECD